MLAPPRDPGPHQVVRHPQGTIDAVATLKRVGDPQVQGLALMAAGAVEQHMSNLGVGERATGPALHHHRCFGCICEKPLPDRVLEAGDLEELVDRLVITQEGGHGEQLTNTRLHRVEAVDDPPVQLRRLGREVI